MTSTTPSLTRREFLFRAAAVGGSALLLNTMNAWGMGIASTTHAPPELSGSGKGKKVVILGAGLAGMTAAFELGKLGYQVEVLEARPFAGGRRPAHGLACSSSKASPSNSASAPTAAPNCAPIGNPADDHAPGTLIAGAPTTL